ncbi:hypothetical protein WPS_14900 [Vulcanimicrobium alpinum]|uniref:MAM domain-containing protein n=1 Tax=Vulcanimicrobium alpinum TaxID=3016050 RepID=A0AAN1XVL8_UNVUL|nr:hypothetical protein [Vulcanimicrobium alpinum]BDE06214.1 hypothetical protein WPS_14900 [Vulcanimicrobium alpinum]
MRGFAPAAAAAVTAVAIAAAAAFGQGPSQNVVSDPGFELPALHAWSQCGTVNARVTTATAHSGTHAMRAGSSSRTSGEIDGDAGLCQRVTIPVSAVLTFWLNGITDETSAEFSYQSAELLDDEGNTVATLWQASLQTNGWARKTVDLSAFAGKTLRLYFGVHGNGYAKRFTILYVDDVTVSGGGAPATPAATGVPTSAPVGSPSAAPATPAGGPTPIPAPQAGGPATCGTHCGTERWHVKTLSDPFASQIDRNVRITTVDELVHAPVPRGCRRAPTTCASHRGNCRQCRCARRSSVGRSRTTTTITS